eukprot:122340_1
MSTLKTKQLLFDGYIRLVIGINNLLVPLCIIELLFEFFTSKHCLMLYSINRQERLGKIQFIDSTYCKNITKTIQHPFITDNMSNFNKTIAFASNVYYPFYDKHNGYDSIFCISRKNNFRQCDILLYKTNNSQFETQLTLPKEDAWDSNFLYSHKLQKFIFRWQILNVNVSSKNDLKCERHNWSIGANPIFIDDDELQIFSLPMNTPTILDLSNETKVKKQTLKQISSKRRRFRYGICSCENNNRIYMVGGESNNGHYGDYLDLIKDKWNKISDSKYLHYEPLLWTDSTTMLYALINDVRGSEIGIIEAFDWRCNKWIDLEKDRQLREAIKVPKSISMYSNANQYVSCKLFTVSF